MLLRLWTYQMIAVWSTLPLNSISLRAFHFSEKIGPLCAVSVVMSFPSLLQTRPIPS